MHLSPVVDPIFQTPNTRNRLSLEVPANHLELKPKLHGSFGHFRLDSIDLFKEKRQIARSPKHTVPLIVPSQKQPDRQFKVAARVTVSLSAGRVVDATVMAIINRTDGVRLQVDYGKDETALVYLWQVRAAGS